MNPPPGADPVPQRAIRKSVRVACPAAEAFRIFTERMADWWPFGGHSLFEDRASGVEFEPRVGGAVEEVSVDGERGRWGTLTAWDPPRRFVMTWHPGRPVETAQELEVRFVPDGAGTIVELEHRGWEKLLERADEAQQGYSGGWGKVLEGYVVECERSGS